MWICEKEIFPKDESSKIWCRLCKIQPLLDNRIGNDHCRQTEQDELRYGGSIEGEKFRKRQRMQGNSSSVYVTTTVGDNSDCLM